MSPWTGIVFATLALVATVHTTNDFTFQSSAINDYEFQSSLQMSDMDLFGFGHLQLPNESCSEVWCELPPNSNYNYYDDLEDEESRGFWLEPPPDDIVYMPPPPMPPSLQAYLMSMENDSFKEFISDDTEERVRCNFCKLFADPHIYEEPIYSPPKENEAFISSFYILILSLICISIFVICILVKYKKLKIFPSDSCPILTGGFLGKSSSSPSNSTSDTRISPVVNEKSPQSIIMDAPLASLGKKSTISTTGKYWKRIPASGTILYMEDRHLRSLGGSSTGISDHPYSDAASCTSSPVYAELDPSVAGSCHTPPIIGPPGTSFSPYAFANAYSEVPDATRHGLSSTILTDSSTYDNAAYLSATSQPPFLPGANNYTSRSLRRLAAQRAAALNAANSGQISTPLLSGHQYHPYHPAQQQHNSHQQPQSQFHFLTGGRQLKKQSRPQANYYKYGNTLANRPMNHYVTHDNSMDSSSGAEMDHMTSFTAFLSGEHHNHHHHQAANRKSSSSSSQYTEMPLLNQSSSSPFSPGSYRMSETNSSHDLHSATSSSSSGTNSSSANSSTSLKRPLPPVPGGVRL